MVVDELDALRNANQGCEMLAFADLSTQMILVTDTAANAPRETLDRLCNEAMTMLGAGRKVVLGEEPSTAALVANSEGVRVFLRAEEEPNDVLCCVCAPELDVEAFVADARERLNRISSGA
jgi:hypothetical protein